MKSALILEDGSAFYGYPTGAMGVARGELCFTTAMMGYQHCLTDPSFAGQVLLFTAPHIGNVGINQEDSERSKPLIKGIVLREPITKSHHFKSVKGLDEWLVESGIVGIYGVDTRALTHIIRKNGAVNCVIVSDFTEENTESIRTFLANCPQMKGREMTAEAIRDNPVPLELIPGHKNKTVVVVDFGLKKSICTALNEYNLVIVEGKPGFFEEVQRHNPDGVVLSNGPGDPDATKEFASPEIQKLMATGIPIFAICLGHQLLAIACGCSTVKMHNGHRGINHPVHCLSSKKVIITSHNHGFMIDPVAIGSEVEITHKSLFDDCIEGIRIKNKPIFSVQYHPEASPGTSDAGCLFSQFREYVNGNS